MAVREVDEDGCALGHQLAIGQDQDRELLHGVDPRDVLGTQAVRVLRAGGLFQLIGLAEQQECRLDGNGAGAAPTIDHIWPNHRFSPQIAAPIPDGLRDDSGNDLAGEEGPACLR